MVPFSYNPMIQETTALIKIKALRRRLRIIQGGARAGKTIGILICLIDLATSHKKLVISVVSENLPHLKRGAVRDFKLIMESRGYWSDDQWNKSDTIYTFKNGSIIEFFGADDSSKVHGPARDVLFVNECNNVPYDTTRQLLLRTAFVAYLDFNPVHEFYVHTDYMHRPDADFIKLTYKDNEALPLTIVREIESLQTNENLWRIYGLGEIGINEGQVFTNWEIISRVPKHARLLRHAVDFGYTNDPSAVGNIYEWNKGFVIHELAYATGLTNLDLANIIRKYERLQPAQSAHRYEGKTHVLTVADSAEPKSIDEIKTYGVNITGSTKGADSVMHGIQTVQRQHLYITEYSIHIIKDVRNYLWKVDRAGRSLNVPQHEFSHAPDMIRYGITDIVNPSKSVFRVRTA